ncbi:MAG: peptidoglycan-associated lipoprotein Pal [Candidatus Krumholzibacteriota bacterium]
MNRGRISRKALLIAGLVLLVALVSLAGCSKKAEVETDPAAGTGVADTTEDLPTETVPEQVEPVVDEGPDYLTLDPKDYGVGDVYFAFDQYDLDDESMGILSNNARIIKEAGVTILVSGHCDERGTVEYNLALGEKRARAVRDYLVSLGVSASQLKVTSYGESKPFAKGSDEDAWARNRRAHFERP